MKLSIYDLIASFDDINKLNQINSFKTYFQQKNISYRNENVHILVFVSKMFYSFASQLSDVRIIMGWHFCWFDRSILFLSHINGCDADVRKIYECHIFFLSLTSSTSLPLAKIGYESLFLFAIHLFILFVSLFSHQNIINKPEDKKWYIKSTRISDYRYVLQLFFSLFVDNLLHEKRTVFFSATLTDAHEQINIQW